MQLVIFCCCYFFPQSYSLFVAQALADFSVCLFDRLQLCAAHPGVLDKKYRTVALKISYFDKEFWYVSVCVNENVFVFSFVHRNIKTIIYLGWKHCGPHDNSANSESPDHLCCIFPTWPPSEILNNWKISHWLRLWSSREVNKRIWCWVKNQRLNRKMFSVDLSK